MTVTSESRVSAVARGRRPDPAGVPALTRHDRFHADIADVVHTHLNAEATTLVVEWWTPTHGLRRIERG